MNHTTQIDQGILSLVNAMNSTEFLETFSCCEGHPDTEHHKRPYVAFFCKSDGIPIVCNILNDIESSFDDYNIAFDLGIIHEPLLVKSQLDAKKGLLALHLRIMARTEDHKKDAFALLSDHFNKLNNKYNEGSL